MAEVVISRMTIRLEFIRRLNGLCTARGTQRILSALNAVAAFAAECGLRPWCRVQQTGVFGLRLKVHRPQVVRVGVRVVAAVVEDATIRT